MSTDIFSGSYETTQGRVYTLSGGDWDTVLGAPNGERERIVVNMKLSQWSVCSSSKKERGWIEGYCYFSPLQVSIY